jgi:hypothetical protein
MTMLGATAELLAEAEKQTEILLRIEALLVAAATAKD